MTVPLFCVTTPCTLADKYHSFSPEAGDAMLLRNVGHNPEHQNSTPNFTMDLISVCYRLPQTHFYSFYYDFVDVSQSA
jgi:hypothetical protein